MLKKSLVLFGMVAAFVGNAGAAAVTPSQESSGDRCYLIGTADELEGFAKNVAASGFSGCAKLTADIQYIGDAPLLKEDHSNLIEVDGKPQISQRPWTPLTNFSGKFDGQNHTIYGLYAKQDTSAAFIGTASGSPVIKNLRIADSYFYVNKSNTCKVPGGSLPCNGAAGLVAYYVSGVNGTTALTIENSSFSGYVGGIEASKVTNGGLVGVVSSKDSIFLKDSYNEGYVAAGAGLVGNVLQNGKIGVTNSYNIGHYTTSPIMGDKAGKGNITISGSNLGCVVPENLSNEQALALCNANFTSTNPDGKSATFVSSSPAAVIANYWMNLYGAKDTIAFKQEINELNEASAGLNIDLEKISITYIDPVTGKDTTIEFTAPVAVLRLELSDEETALEMPKDLEVYAVRYGRTFTSSSSTTLCDGGYNVSTTVLPFSMEVEKIHGGKFFSPELLYRENVEDKDWIVKLNPVMSKIEAHTPYIVCPTAEMLTFDGGTTVRQTNGSAGITTFERDPPEPSGRSWEFVGLYQNKEFLSDCPAGVEPENCEAGRVYAFKDGAFVRVTRGSSRILRAYIRAPYGSRPSLMPSLLKTMASAETSVISDRPDRLLLEVDRYDEERYLTTITWDEFYKEIEDVTEIRKPLIFPVRKAGDSWYDFKGRYMKRKPSARGVYMNNGNPSVVR